MSVPKLIPKGAKLISDWISPADEAALIAFLDAGDWSGELKRRVQHFGYRYDYRARVATRDRAGSGRCRRCLPVWRSGWWRRGCSTPAQTR